MKFPEAQKEFLILMKYNVFLLLMLWKHACYILRFLHFELFLYFQA